MAQTVAPATGSAGPDYDAPDVLVVREPEQLKALGDELRGRIVVMLRERAQSVSELAAKLEMPKGTVAHHVKVLESAGLLKVVRTRRVRALTESYYGRSARLFLYESADTAGYEDVRNIVAASLRVAAEEILPVDEEDAAACSGVLRVRLRPADAKRFDRRLTKLMDEFRACDDADGTPYGLALALYRRAPDA
ncbi:MAG TPA: winged helix-turn-helix domain-containing protein [Gaiellaceae bacterium]